jgi:hypothetical protein
MQANVLVLDQDAALVAHITGRRSWVLIIVTVILDGQSFSWGFPVSANGEFLGVVAGPDLDLVNVIIRKPSSLHLIGESLTIAVVTFFAEKEVLLTTDKDLKVSDEILWQISASKVVLNLGKNSGEGLGLDVLGSVHTET